jgi:hypothetical protein
MSLILRRRAEGIKDNDQLRMVAQVKAQLYLLMRIRNNLFPGPAGFLYVLN